MIQTVYLLPPGKIVFILSVTFAPGFVSIVLEIYFLWTIGTMMRILSSIYPIIGASNRRFLLSREHYLVHLNWIMTNIRHCQTLILILTLFYHSSFPSCDYHSEDTFNDMCLRHNVSDSKLTMIHSNIKSIPCNLYSFDAFLENLSINFTVIVFTETWLEDTNPHAFGWMSTTVSKIVD